jgi:hypothetical protein
MGIRPEVKKLYKLNSGKKQQTKWIKYISLHWRPLVYFYCIIFTYFLLCSGIFEQVKAPITVSLSFSQHVRMQDCLVVAKLIGMKLLVTELPAFQELAAIQVITVLLPAF